MKRWENVRKLLQWGKSHSSDQLEENFSRGQIAPKVRHLKTKPRWTNIQRTGHLRTARQSDDHPFPELQNQRPVTFKLHQRAVLTLKAHDCWHLCVWTCVRKSCQACKLTHRRKISTKDSGEFMKREIRPFWGARASPTRGNHKKLTASNSYREDLFPTLKVSLWRLKISERASFSR